MAIDVRYPDGSWHAVPSQLCPIDPATTGTQARFRHMPINSDPHWRFLCDGTVWHARPRHGALAIWAPPLDDWWQGIAAMADGPTLADMAEQDAQPPRAA